MFKDKFNDSIRFRFLSVMTVILFVGTLVISLVVAINEGRVLKNSLVTMGQSFASYIAKLSKDPLVMRDSIQLDAIVNDANKDEDIAYCIIRDVQGVPLTTQFASINYQVPRLNAFLAGLSSDNELQDIVESIKRKEPILEVSIPVMIDMKTIGTVIIGMSEYRVNQQIVKTVIFVIALNMAMAFVLGVALFVVSKKIVLDPLIEIAHASSHIAKGDLSTEVKVRATGEVKTLVDSFNEMVKNLEKVTVSKDYMDNIIRSMINTLIVVSPENKIIRANDAACRLLGYQEEELIGQPAETIFAGNRALEDSWMKSTLVDGHVGNIEESYRTKDGREVPVLLSASVMGDHSGLIRGIVLAAQDITERKQAEEALRESEEKYRTILENIEDSYVETDIAGNLTFFNPSTYRMLGYSADEVSGINYRRLMDEAGASGVKKVFENVYQTGKSVKLTDYELTRKDGTKISVESSISLTKDARGIPIGFRGIARDITEHKRMESEKIYKTLTESSLAGVYVVQDGEFRFINSNAASYAGYVSEELVNHEAGHLVHPEDREIVRTNARAMLHGERISPYEFRIITKDGEIRWIMETVASISYEGKPAVLGNSMDITDRKKAALQLLQSEKMASIGQLAAGVAHEINNPTAFVSSNLKTLADYIDHIIKLINQYRSLSEYLKKGVTEDTIRERLIERLKLIEDLEDGMDINFIVEDVVPLIAESREGTERIRRIVQDLKNFAHPGDEKLRTVNVNDSIESTLNIVWNELKYKAVVHKEYGNIPEIMGYPQQLNQVFMNILVNAAQAIKDRGEIRIATRVDDGHAEMRFTDSGAGIPKENLPKLFDPFFTTKDVGKGTGLGLHVAYSIIKKHNGTIEVDSMVNKGTTFTIRIPLGRE